MVGEITTALTSLKTAFDMAKAISDIAKGAEVQSAVIGLQRQILDAQGAALAAIDRENDLREDISKLKRKIAGLETWAKEKRRYELEMIPPGYPVYSLRQQAANGEPDHKLCATCFNQDRKSILTSFRSAYGNSLVFECPVCKDQMHTSRS